MVETFSLGKTSAPQGACLPLRGEKFNSYKSFKNFLKRHSLIVLFLGMFVVPNKAGAENMVLLNANKKSSSIRKKVAVGSLIKVLTSIYLVKRKPNQVATTAEGNITEKKEEKHFWSDFNFSGIIIAVIEFIVAPILVLIVSLYVKKKHGLGGND